MTWLFNEDAALKAKLQGMSVTDVNAPSGRNVAVWFRLPETELRDLSFPCVVIDHAGLERDEGREHRGKIPIPYAPEGYALWDTSDLTMYDPSTSPYLSDFPIPYNLSYQITVMSRKIQHHMTLVQTMATFDKLPSRFGYLAIPQDGTVRRVDLLGGPNLRDYKDRDGKRTFEATYLISVSTELFLSQIAAFVTVQQLLLTLEEKDSQRALAQFQVNYATPIGP